MNKIIMVFAIAGYLCSIGCTKETTPEARVVESDLKRSDNYFANLRAYKKSDHEVFFGWFGSSAIPGSAEVPPVEASIPDSVDIVSLWGGIPKDTSYAYQIMQKTRELKGTRFVMVTFDNIPFLNSWTDTSNFAAKYDRNDSLLTIGLNIIAKRLNDTIQKYHLDGLDLDHEPTVSGGDWGVLKNNRKYGLFLKALSKYLGPLSGTDKILIVDGEYDMSSDAATSLSYIVSQAYNTPNPFSLENRAKGLPAGFPLKKFIVTENLEGNGAGGYPFDDPIRGRILSLEGMAYWEPVNGRKGGMGSYHTETEYGSNPDYQYTTRCIQIMNPAAK